MDVNLKKIKKQLLLLYYLLNDQNDIEPQRKQLFIQAVKENISKSRKNNPLVVQLANELAAAMLIIEEQKQVIKELEFEFYSPLRLHSDLEAILEHDKNFYDAQRKLKIKNSDGDAIPVGLNPKDIICIITSNEKDDKIVGRKKIIYEKKEWVDKPTEINKYYLNSQELPNGESLNLENLCTYLDPWRHHLLNVSQGAIINVEHYYFETENCLQLNFNAEIDIEAIQIKIPKKGTEIKWVKSQMVKIREDRNNRRILQKKAKSYIDSNKATD